MTLVPSLERVEKLLFINNRVSAGFWQKEVPKEIIAKGMERVCNFSANTSRAAVVAPGVALWHRPFTALSSHSGYL